MTVDGPLAWQQVELPPAWSPEVVVEGPAGLLVVASRDDRLDRWAEVFALNSDHGIDWTVLESGRFSEVVHIDGLVGADSGYVAYGLFTAGEFTDTTVGRPANFPEPAVWTSIDGVVWELTPLPLPGRAERISEIVSYSIFDLAVSGDLHVAVGTEFDEDLPDGAGEVVVPTRQVLWATTESGGWDLIDDERLADAEGAAAGPSGIITTTRTADGEIDVWGTTDGATWEQLGVIRQNGFVDGAGWVHANPQGFVVGAAEAMHWSPDGETWRSVSAPDGMAYIGRAAASARAVIVIGQTRNGSGRLFIGTEPG